MTKTLGLDTLTVTINAVGIVLNRINQDAYASQYYYGNATDSYTVNIRHTKESATTGKPQMIRHNIEFIHVKFGVAPAPDVTRNMFTTIREPYNDDIAAGLLDFKGFAALVDTNQVITDLQTWIN
jgi:hypothetical protein